jgi:hypothetical protein
MPEQQAQGQQRLVLVLVLVLVLQRPAQEQPLPVLEREWALAAVSPGFLQRPCRRLQARKGRWRT